MASAVAPGVATGSQLIARNTSTERLAVSADGKALLTYHGQGRLQRVLAWGATNARQPTQVVEQTEFRVDYSGGWGTFGRPVWKGFRNACGRYRGPALPFLVTACTARDGSHWAVQRWRRHQANFGLPPWKSGHGAWELRLSHWRGPVAKLEAWLDWSYARPLAPPLRPADLPRAPGPRLLDDSDGRSARSVRPRPLPRHAGFGVRRRLVPRERVRRAQAGRNLLLRLRPAHEPHGRAASGRERSALPARGVRAGCDAGRGLGGSGSSELRRRQPEARRARGEHERTPASLMSASASCRS